MLVQAQLLDQACEPLVARVDPSTGLDKDRIGALFEHVSCCVQARGVVLHLVVPRHHPHDYGIHGNVEFGPNLGARDCVRAKLLRVEPVWYDSGPVRREADGLVLGTARCELKMMCLGCRLSRLLSLNSPLVTRRSLSTS